MHLSCACSPPLGSTLCTLRSRCHHQGMTSFVRRDKDLRCWLVYLNHINNINFCCLSSSTVLGDHAHSTPFSGCEDVAQYQRLR
jgi:hypothetical protein